MTTALEDFRRSKEDVTKYVPIDDVDIFDEHDEPYWCLPDGRTEDDAGKPVTKRTPGAERRVEKFDKARLELIAESSNREDSVGNYSPLSVGHINPDEISEERLPPQVGYADGYKVVYSPDLKKHVIRTRFLFHADDFEAAKPYGSISVELWPTRNTIWPIALLKRAPQRSLPRWHYRRGGPSRFSGGTVSHAQPGRVLRYSMESTAMPNRYEMPDDADAPDAFSLDGSPDMPAVAPAESGEPSPEEYKQYAMHCAGHPHAAKISAYAMQDAPAEVPAEVPAEPAAPYAAFPSSTNATLPGAKAKPFQRDDPKPRTPAQDAEAIRYQRTQAQLRESAAKIAALEIKAAESDARRRVSQLVGECYEVDAEEEVKIYSRLNETQRDEHEKYFRKVARKDVAAPVGRIPLREDEPRKPSDVVEGDISKEHMERALTYSRQKGLKYDRFTEAVEATRNTK